MEKNCNHSPVVFVDEKISVDEIVNHFVEIRTKPFRTLAGFMYNGDIFYSDIYHYLKNVMKIKNTYVLHTVHRDVCDKLRDKHFFIHS